jgi:hypothetical protein
MSGMCHGIEAAGTVIWLGQQQRGVRVSTGDENAQEKNHGHQRATRALSGRQEMDEEGESIHELLGRRGGTESPAATTKTMSATTNTTISAGMPTKTVVPCHSSSGCPSRHDELQAAFPTAPACYLNTSTRFAVESAVASERECCMDHGRDRRRAGIGRTDYSQVPDQVLQELVP